jgi:hypothetical protein
MDRITRIAPSARVELQIEELLTKGLGEASEHLAELGRLGARLVLQRAVDEEVAAFLVSLAMAMYPWVAGVVPDFGQGSPHWWPCWSPFPGH